MSVKQREQENSSPSEVKYKGIWDPKVNMQRGPSAPLAEDDMKRQCETNWLDCFIQGSIPLTCPPCHQNAWNHIGVRALQPAN